MALTRCLLYLSCTLLVCLPVAADQFLQADGYEIHYATFPSTIIPADVATAHEIVRAKNRMVTNVAVMQSGKSVRATVSGISTNLLAQKFKLDFKEVMEQDAIYYLANQIVGERDTIAFFITVTPDQGDNYEIEFRRTYQ